MAKGNILDQKVKKAKTLNHMQNERCLVNESIGKGMNLTREDRVDEALAELHVARAELDKLIAFASELA